ncbi:hypothetical protein SAMN05216436_101120 [bacterium A37T11]|nr:hypothetical protein SAMN05216436_101120 [bacterium A37T11]
MRKHLQQNRTFIFGAYYLFAWSYYANFIHVIMQNLKKAKTSVHGSALAVLLISSLLITLYSCGKPGDGDEPDPDVENPTGCALASDVDQSLGLRNFEYDDKGLLTKMTGPNYYYGPFVRTIAPDKVIDAYPSSSVDGLGHHYYGTITITYTYSGGSGNIYDGNPEYINQLFASTISGSSTTTNLMFQYLYDDPKKHLTSVLIPADGYSKDADGFSFIRYEFSFTYDAHDNVTQVKIIMDWSKKITDYPSGESRIDYKQTSDELLNITYDDKPSPYTSISKYWKFIGNDFNGFGAYNLDGVRFWAGRCAILSKNNPVKITGKLFELNNATAKAELKDINTALTYEYNDKNLPVSMTMNWSGSKCVYV